MKRKPSLLTQLKRTLSPIIRKRLLKVKRWEDARIEFEGLSTAEQIEILDELQKFMDSEVKKQFEKIQKARTITGYSQPEIKKDSIKGEARCKH